MRQSFYLLAGKVPNPLVVSAAMYQKICKEVERGKDFLGPEFYQMPPTFRGIPIVAEEEECEPIVVTAS
jgi:hypothetical protein